MYRYDSRTSWVTTGISFLESNGLKIMFTLLPKALFSHQIKFYSNQEFLTERQTH